MGDFVKSLIKDIIIALVLAMIILYFIRPTIVRQTSMQPTLNPGNYLILYKQAYRSKTPQRGDIIVFESDLVDDDGEDKLLIKRVIGLPGDVIEIAGDQLYINGELYEEDYLKDGITTGSGTWTVPEDSYFVMGDNRVVSVDSRYEEVGYVTSDQIRGRAVLRLYPFDQITTL